jgi:23S rRNA pseudouridine1911/1915/1917 synthase
MIEHSANGLTYQILPQDCGKTIQRILQNKLHLSRILIRDLKQNQSICCNGIPTPAYYIVKTGDIIVVQWQTPVQAIRPFPLPLSIIYEDPDILVINKAWGMLSHPVGQFQDNTVANAVIYHWNTTNTTASFHPVSRLDRNTSGLMLIAKHKWVHQQMNEASQRRTMRKGYVAIVHGRVTDTTGTIDAPIARLPGSIISRHVAADGQSAITHYQVLEHYTQSTKVSIELATGRTHQIRVHFAYIGHPLLGDTLYGGSDELITRQALHASQLTFNHPRTKDNLTFSAPLPQDMGHLLSSLQNQ